MQRKLILAASFGSTALLGGAFIFQALGYAPCAMCIWQRYPHAAAVALGAFALVLPLRVLPAKILAMLGALAALVTAGLGVFHTGVERAWWDGPSTCSSGSIDGLSAEELLDQIMAAPLVRCDEVAWQFIGLSMASWNAILSFGLVLIWLAAVRAPPKSPA